MRVLAVDYGERRTGVAVSDELGITAQGLETIVVKDSAELPERVAALARDLGAGTVLVGLPLNMNGTEGEKCAKVRAFGEALRERSGVNVVYWDERMTSVQAHRVMRELNVKTRGNKEQVDRIAATLILQEYLKTF